MQVKCPRCGSASLTARSLDSEEMERAKQALGAQVKVETAYMCRDCESLWFDTHLPFNILQGAIGVAFLLMPLAALSYYVTGLEPRWLAYFLALLSPFAVYQGIQLMKMAVDGWIIASAARRQKRDYVLIEPEEHPVAATGG